MVHSKSLDTIKGGAIPGEYIPPIEKGFKEGLDRGILAGFKMENVSVELYDGSYHEVDSNEMAFKIAASMAITDAANAAKPVILEPMMKVEVVTPEKFFGDVTGSMSSRRGLIEGMETRGMNQVVNAVVPLSNVWIHDNASFYDRRSCIIYDGIPPLRHCSTKCGSNNH